MNTRQIIDALAARRGEGAPDRLRADLASSMQSYHAARDEYDRTLRVFLGDDDAQADETDEQISRSVHARAGNADPSQNTEADIAAMADRSRTLAKLSATAADAAAKVADAMRKAERFLSGQGSGQR